jgi:enduracididine beta-hydroxylase
VTEWGRTLIEIDVAHDEALEIQRLTRSIGQAYGSSDNEALLRDLPSLAEQLPPRVADAVVSYMEDAVSDAIVIRNHLVDDEALGSTPSAWKTPASQAASLEHEMVPLLYGSLLGAVFGWVTQQHGHVVNDIIPIASQANAQVGASSRVELAWHTEDAFHPGRADFISLYCLRNFAGAPTTISSVIDVLRSLQPDRALFGPCVRIAADDAQAAGAAEIEGKDWSGDALDAIPILIETPVGVEMCVDPAYMSVYGDDENVHQAVRRFCDSVEAHLNEVVLRAGDLMILHNRRVVHGRRPFKASYDGRDRWLKRVNIAREFDVRLPYCQDVKRRLLA